MTEPTPVYLQITLKLAPGEEVHAEPAGHEWHIFGTVGKIRRLVGRVVPVLPRSARQRHGSACALDPAELAAEMAAAR